MKVSESVDDFFMMTIFEKFWKRRYTKMQQSLGKWLKVMLTFLIIPIWIMTL